MTNATTATTPEERRKRVLRELDSYRDAIGQAFQEGFEMAQMRGPLRDAWDRSEARQAQATFAYTRMSVGGLFVERGEPATCRDCERAKLAAADGMGFPYSMCMVHGPLRRLREADRYLSHDCGDIESASRCIQLAVEELERSVGIRADGEAQPAANVAAEEPSRKSLSAQTSERHRPPKEP